MWSSSAAILRRSLAAGPCDSSPDGFVRALADVALNYMGGLALQLALSSDSTDDLRG